MARKGRGLLITLCVIVGLFAVAVVAVRLFLTREKLLAMIVPRSRKGDRREGVDRGYRDQFSVRPRRRHHGALVREDASRYERARVHLREGDGAIVPHVSHQAEARDQVRRRSGGRGDRDRREERARDQAPRARRAVLDETGGGDVRAEREGARRFGARVGHRRSAGDDAREGRLRRRDGERPRFHEDRRQGVEGELERSRDGEDQGRGDQRQDGAARGPDRGVGREAARADSRAYPDVQARRARAGEAAGPSKPGRRRPPSSSPAARSGSTRRSKGSRRSLSR